ncbi:MAG: lysophospholipase [Syntrophobacterales bacterium]|jgi:alpha-beta hydrolase superfamily lysophospholipase|nr:lysophospholipase [Syntrophobacterales bacterium]
MPDYTLLDNSSALEYIFYPRDTYSPCPAFAFDLPVPVDKDISISCRFYRGNPEWPWILFFHGNGEVISDYDEISPFYFKKNINLVVVDYRGYGKSGGTPTITDMLGDAHKVLEAVKKELAARGLKDKLWVMGRSLGSLSALELAYHYQYNLPGIIIESGFLSITRILDHLDLTTDGPKLPGIEDECIAMVRMITLPVLIVHGEHDNLVPFAEAEDLYNNIKSEDKQLLMIPAADHNDVMFVGLHEYFKAIRIFMDRTDTGAE